MLIKFLLFNKFPNYCFLTKSGVASSYKIAGNKIVFYYHDGHNEQFQFPQLPIMLVDIPERMFKLFISFYKQIIAILKSASLEEIFTESRETSGNLTDNIIQSIIFDLPNNPIIPVRLEGMVVAGESALGNYGVNHGEIIYITGNTSTDYSITAIDGITTRIPRKYIKITGTSRGAEFSRKWEEALQKIEQEYEQFKGASAIR